MLQAESRLGISQTKLKSFDVPIHFESKYKNKLSTVKWDIFWRKEKENPSRSTIYHLTFVYTEKELKLCLSNSASLFTLPIAELQ